MSGRPERCARPSLLRRCCANEHYFRCNCTPFAMTTLQHPPALRLISHNRDARARRPTTREHNHSVSTTSRNPTTHKDPTREYNNSRAPTTLRGTAREHKALAKALVAMTPHGRDAFVVANRMDHGASVTTPSPVRPPANMATRMHVGHAASREFE